MSTADNNNDMKCAACGKAGDDLKECNRCKLVKYCNAACKKKHRSKHKKKCQRRAAEIFDEALFKEPPSRDECDICMLTLPFEASYQKYQVCCGKMLCAGCIHAAFMADNRKLCPFCRTPGTTSDGEYMDRLNKRVEGDDAVAIHLLGSSYDDGANGLQQDHEKAVELWLRSGELGYAGSYFNIGNSYYTGRGVESDVKKAVHYWELAAMGGHVIARHNLGCIEENAGNKDRAVKHYMIAAGAGDDDSLEQIRQCFLNGQATKDDFEKALRAHKEAKDKVKSDQREAVALLAAAR
jgi:TPR repeat protein